MVISETIICQRFIQNAWKKDLCSNCFKSKEDHAVIPEKKITYRWTSHVNNFPQHGILKDRQKNGKEKSLNVAFRTEETEIIGFGGEEYSSDDDDYPVYHENCSSETDNEEEDKEFRKLTKSNTDYNSIAANLKKDKCATGDGQVNNRNAYSDLKFGRPVVDAEGRRQTLQVTIEPFKNSVIMNGVRNNDGKSCTNSMMVDNNYLRNDKTDKNDENKENSDRTNETGAANRDDRNNVKNKDCISNVVNGNRCGEVVAHKDGTRANHKNTIGDLSISCDNSNKVSDDSVNILSVNSNDAENGTNNVFVKVAPNVTEESKYTKVSNVMVDGSPAIEKIAESASGRGSKSKSESSTSSTMNIINDSLTIEDRSKSPFRSFSCLETDSIEKEKRTCSMNKDCNPINLPLLMVCKPLDIEFDNPGSREMVGEPDGKADSDDSCDPVSSIAHSASPITPHATKITASIIDSSICVDPQRSFLHDFSDGKPKLSAKPVTVETPSAEATATTAAAVAAVIVAASNETPKKATSCKESSEATMTNGLPCTPKIQIPITCNGTGSVKRQAPKPPSPKIIAPSPLFVAPIHLDGNLTPIFAASDSFEKSALKCESPLVGGQRDAISFLSGDQNTNIRRKLNLDSVMQPNRNSLNVCVSASPNGTDSLKRYSTLTCAGQQNYFTLKDSDTASICSVDRKNPPKCSRSLSCDSIISPSVMAALPEKTRKYSGATIRVKSKIRKLLRFTTKEDEKLENDVSQPVTLRKRIEIIHPLDLNKSSIEILGSNNLNLVNGDSEAKKKVECENGEACRVSPACGVIYATCPAGRPTKPPPPPRTQSLDQKFSEISRPVRPPPPKCGNLKPMQSPVSNATAAKLSSNLYENIGQSRSGIAPAKPQRASSIRERTRQITSVTSVEESFASLISDNEAVPECDQNLHQLSDSSESPPVSSMTYCGSETESDIYDSANRLKDNSERKGKGVMHNSLEDNYGAVVVANHEALSRLSERVNQATRVPTSFKVLQTTLHIRFEHLTINEDSRIVVADWNFFNALWNNHKVVISISARNFGSMRSLPSSITLYPLVKFNDIVPSRILNSGVSEGVETNAYITIWNEECVDTIDSYCSNLNTNSDNECGLLLTQLTNVLMHLQNCAVNDISLDEILICKRETLVEPKLLLLPFNVDYVSSSMKDTNKNRMALCKCVLTMVDRLLPEQSLTRVIKRILEGEQLNTLSQIKAVVEYWLWGPCGTAITGDRTTSLQRWLDLERATCLHKMICKSPSEISLYETCHMMFLVRTNAKTLTEASFIFERQS